MTRNGRVGWAVAIVLAASVGAWPLLRGGDRATTPDGVLLAGSDSTPRVLDLGALPREVRESSGLAVSRAHPNLFWTHNDSGDEPRLYALDSTAALVGTVEVVGVSARDWEAMDLGPCPGGPVEVPGCLYVADTGDNGRERAEVAVHVLSEPDPRAVPGGRLRVDALATVRFSYEGGPFDVEALAVAPGGEVIVVTKGRTPGIRAFVVDPATVARAAESGEVLALTDAIRLPLGRGRLVTGGSVHAQGTILAVRTYTEVYFYEWPLAPEPAEAAPPCRVTGLEPIGEAVAFSGDGRLYLTSESPRALAGHLLRVRCPGVPG